MRALFTRILEGFEYQSAGEWWLSLAPSFKYNLVTLGVGLSAGASLVETLFGFDGLAFLGFLVVMAAELGSGIWASRLRQEAFSSRRMSRFTFKCAIYLVLVSVPYLFAASYHARGKDFAGGAFDWLHIFLTYSIVVENIISILENYAVIQGKDKTHWIDKIRKKTDQILS